MKRAIHLYLLMREMEAGKGFTARQVAHGHGVSLRSAQRMLADLSTVAPLVVETQWRRPPVWRLQT